MYEPNEKERKGEDGDKERKDSEDKVWSVAAVTAKAKRPVEKKNSPMYEPNE